MIRFTHLKGSPGAVAKYAANERQPGKDQEKARGYYSEKGGAPSQWVGRGAEAQGLAGPVHGEDLERALSGTTSAGEDISARGNRESERRMGSDLNFSAPKSVSILAAVDERIGAAQDRAVASALKWAEENMAFARIGKGGAVSEFTGNLMAAVYRHEDARSADGAVDPHFHSHALVINQTQREDGQWVSVRLDFGQDNAKLKTLNLVYLNNLARELKALGYQVVMTKDAFEVKGITRAQIEAFSSRSAQIKDDLAARGQDRESATEAQRTAAQNATRGDKTQLSREDQRWEWRERFREKGIDTDRIMAEAKERAAQPMPARDERAMAAEAVRSAIRHLGERATVFSKTELVKEALEAGLGEVSHEAILEAIEAKEGGLLDAGEVDRDGTGKMEQIYTTKAHLYREAEILQRARDGRGQAQAIIPTRITDTGLENQEVVPLTVTEKEQQNGTSREGSKKSGIEPVGPLSGHHLRDMQGRRVDADAERQDPGVLQDDARADRPGDPDVRRAGGGREPGLGQPMDPAVAGIIADYEAKLREKIPGFAFSRGQKEAIHMALTTQDRHSAIVGAAGAGKTTALELIVEQYRAAGYEIIGVAPTNKAREEMQGAGCDAVHTLASLIASKGEENKGGQEDQKPKLYLMDEAGMASGVDMAKFLALADGQGARTLLVGDYDQLQSVEAGHAFEQLIKSKALEHSRIREINRQKDPQLLAIAQAFADRDPERAVELARPYMTQIQIQDEDWAAAEAMRPDAGSAQNQENQAPATEKMLKLAEDKGYEGDASFGDVRRFLDQNAYYVGLQEGSAPAAPKEVRQAALARTAADAYLALTPEERASTLVLSGTNAVRQAINEKVREGLKAEGSLGEREVRITALDKLDLTKEGATRAEMFAPQHGGKVVVEFQAGFTLKRGSDDQEKIGRGSRWAVLNNEGGKLTLRSFDDPESVIEMDPAKAKLGAYETREMGLSLGDQVMFRQNDKARGIYNGTTGTVSGISEDGKAQVQLANGKTVEIDQRKAEVLDYSYARTVHASQGATVDRVIAVGEAGARGAAELGYVALSRERYGLSIITDNIEKYSKQLSRWSERKMALDEAKGQERLGDLNAIKEARSEAIQELGRHGDISKIRDHEREGEELGADKGENEKSVDDSQLGNKEAPKAPEHEMHQEMEMEI